jgi:hypothetical protein
MAQESFVTPIVEAIRSHNALPPYEKNLARGAGGAAIITMALWFGVPALAYGAPAPGFIIGWFVVLAFGFLWLIVGWRNSRAPRDPIKVWWAGVELVIGLLLLNWSAGNWLFMGISVGIVVEGAVGMLMVLRGLPPHRLPDPAQVAGMPMAGPASRREAARSLRGRPDWQPPRFSN